MVWRMLIFNIVKLYVLCHPQNIVFQENEKVILVVIVVQVVQSLPVVEVNSVLDIRVEIT